MGFHHLINLKSWPGNASEKKKNMYFGKGNFFGSFALSQNMRIKFKDTHYNPNPLVGQIHELINDKS